MFSLTLGSVFRLLNVLAHLDVSDELCQFAFDSLEVLGPINGFYGLNYFAERRVCSFDSREFTRNISLLSALHRDRPT